MWKRSPIHELERRIEDKDRELQSITLDNEAVCCFFFPHAWFACIRMFLNDLFFSSLTLLFYNFFTGLGQGWSSAGKRKRISNLQVTFFVEVFQFFSSLAIDFTFCLRSHLNTFFSILILLQYIIYNLHFSWLYCKWCLFYYGFVYYTTLPYEVIKLWKRNEEAYPCKLQNKVKDVDPSRGVHRSPPYFSPFTLIFKSFKDEAIF